MEVCQDVGAWEKIIKNSLDIVCTIEPNGKIKNVNEACKRVLGYESAEMVGRHFKAFVWPEDHDSSSRILQDIMSGYKTNSFENKCIHKSGKIVHFVWSGVWSEEDSVILCIGRDVTEQKRLNRKLHEKDALYHALVERSSDMLALFDEQLSYLFCGGSILREFGYKPEQLIGANIFDFIHREDVPKVQESLSRVVASEGYVVISDFRFKDAKGAWRWLETKLSNQLDHPDIKALVASSRDITERINNRCRLEESEQRFKSLFDHHLDMVLFQNKEGVTIDANPAALSFFEVQKQVIINRPFADFFPPEILPVWKQTSREALNGQSVRFELAIPFEGKGLYTFDISKVPVIVNDKTIGVYTIFRDTTAVSHSNNTIKQQAEKLNAILESITDAFFMLDRQWNFNYVNREFEKILKLEREQLLGNNIWEIFPEEVNGEFYRQYHQALETGKTAHFKAYYEKNDIWLEVKAFPSEEGLSVFLNDITERVKAKQELEKLSMVASKTTNGVLILDSQGLAEWVNEGFTNLTGYTFSEVKGRFPGSILSGEETDKSTVKRIRENLQREKPFTEEVLIYKKSGEKRWLLVDFTPILDDAGEIARFIVIETDITFRKEAEVRQLQLSKELYSQNRDLQQFTYIVSHNLRSPVSTAMGLVGLLTATDKDSADFDLSLHYLKKSIHNMDAVLKDLNMILSVRDKNGMNEKEEVSLASICRQVIEDMKEPLEKCDGEVFMSIGEDNNVRGNAAYFYSIFYNLLSNAIKYRCPERKLKVHIKCFRSKEKGTIISFSDNGSGFDMNLAGDKLFQLYKRFHAHSEGRGMGLYLVRTHLEAMGGHIEVRSQPKVGTRFLLYLK